MKAGCLLNPVIGTLIFQYFQNKQSHFIDVTCAAALLVTIVEDINLLALISPWFLLGSDFYKLSERVKKFNSVLTAKSNI